MDTTNYVLHMLVWMDEGNNQSCTLEVKPELKGSVQASLPVEGETGGSRSGVFVAGFLSPGDNTREGVYWQSAPY